MADKKIVIQTVQPPEDNEYLLNDDTHRSSSLSQRGVDPREHLGVMPLEKVANPKNNSAITKGHQVEKHSAFTEKEKSSFNN